MPLTISHAAAALPIYRLCRGRLPLAALMLGSMSPDFAYFLPFGIERVSTHSIPGVLVFCWPIAMAVWFFYVRVLERPSLALLPDSWRPRFPASDRLTWRAAGSASLGIVSGAFTHLIWDAFTHSNTTVTQNIPFFHVTLFADENFRLPLYRFLQHLSTVIGLALLARWLVKLLAAPHPERLTIHEALPPVTAVDRIFSLLFIAGMAALMAIVHHALHPSHSIDSQLFHIAVGGMTGCALAWILVAISIGNRATARAATPSARRSTSPAGG